MGKKLPKKSKKARKKKKIDHEKEMGQYLTKASISLGAAHYHAVKIGNEELAADILDAAIASERLESAVLGKVINRLNGGM